MSDSSFTIHGDEPVEARIVSWVLGEASAFEVAELERLCGERPELMVFRRRMLALHGLLTEAEAAERTDDAWKLPVEKRKVLDELFGEEKVREIEQEKRVRRSGRRALLAIAACLVLTIVVLQVVHPIWEKPSSIRETPKIVNYSAATEAEAGSEGRERRKVPATIARTKGGGYLIHETYTLERGADEGKKVEAMKDQVRDEAIKRGLDAQDYADATRGFESDVEMLQTLKRKQLEASTSESLDAASLGRRELSVSAEPAAPPRQMDSAEFQQSSSDPFAGGSPSDGTSYLSAGSSRLEAKPATPGELNRPERMAEPGGAVTEPAALAEGLVVEKAPALGDKETESLSLYGSSSAPSQFFRAPAEVLEEIELAKHGSRGAYQDESRMDLPGFRGADMGTSVPADGWVDRFGRKAGMQDSVKKEDLARKSLVDLIAEVSAAEDPYSTFSLNISDASFQVARAALAKGEQPDPAGIKVEQFYNAVDYGDPSPASGEPVAVAIEQCASPVIPGRNLVRIALKTAAAGRSAAQPLRLTLLVDQSGSMVREDRRAAMDKALAGLSGLLTENDLVSVIGFSRTPRLLADGMKGDQAAGLADLVNQSAAEGGTNLEMAIALADQMAERRKLEGAQNRIVLFTDGAANLGNADPERLAEKVKALRQKGIAFDIAGIAADGLNDALLGELARNGNGRYYVVGKGAEDDFGKQLAGAFRPAAENVKVQVRFNPERVGSYRLIGFEKDRLKTEDFRNDAVDAAELAAEEAGVAIYQVEPLADGRGEIGEVSVRFRDTAGDEMVERTWTIPHEPAAPAFDRAGPSMQLAVLAMLAGEKLRGGPLAEAIDFRQFAEPLGEVKRFFGGSRRVGEVLRMIDEMK